MLIRRVHLNIFLLNDKSTLQMLNNYKVTSNASFNICNKLSLHRLENDGL